jgi:hypothetical protein
MTTQQFIDNILEAARQERTQSQMTLGALINILKYMPANSKIENISNPHSYRGYYSDLSFEKIDGTRTVESLLKELQENCLNKIFEGYKGGDFCMGEDAPLWIAEYGNCGEKIIGIANGDIITFNTEEDD